MDVLIYRHGQKNGRWPQQEVDEFGSVKILLVSRIARNQYRDDERDGNHHWVEDWRPSYCSLQELCEQKRNQSQR